VCSAQSRHSAAASANVASRFGRSATSARSVSSIRTPSPAPPPGDRGSRQADGRAAGASRTQRYRAPPMPGPAAGSTAARSSRATSRPRRRCPPPPLFRPGTGSHRLVSHRPRLRSLDRRYHGAISGATTRCQNRACGTPVERGNSQYSSEADALTKNCHAEGRGFEPLQPLVQKPRKSRGSLLPWGLGLAALRNWASGLGIKTLVPQIRSGRPIGTPHARSWPLGQVPHARGGRDRR